MSKEYIVRAFEEECDDEYYRVIVPDDVTKGEVMQAFDNATKYVSNSSCFADAICYKHDIDDVDDIRENDFARFVELGEDTFDKHFEKMLEVEEEHRLEIFQYYITDCMGWEIEDFSCDYEFEW